MKMLKILILILAVNSSALADCNSVWKLCDKDLEKTKNLVFEQGKQIINYENQTALQQRIIEDQSKKLDSVLHDPIKVATITALCVVVLEISLGVFHK